ncbi:MAG: sn-glycerol-1-phosphate dehydrogenase [Clostridiaceae bacterium]|nr:sn-glycerol-1-phosphate dehydrogenase [Clostridiaceae bacterium]
METDYFSARQDPSYWYDQADFTTVKGWLGSEIVCPACGRSHKISTRLMEERSKMTDHISEYLPQLGLGGSCVVVMDENTKRAAGDRLMAGLADYAPRAVVFTRDDLHADEEALGSLMIALGEKPDFLVACGSGTITDITRYNSYMTGIPFISYATAASVDGFASGTTPLLVQGFKTTCPGTAPLGIFYDAAVLAAAPDSMTAAGFGDVLAKIIALIDWRLAFAAEDEPYCPLIAAIVDRAVEACLELADDLAVIKPDNKVKKLSDIHNSKEKEAKLKRDQEAALLARGQACVKLMDTLSLTGIAMQMMGTSRPASGSDHHISHLLEMNDIRRHKKGSLHGDKVGIGTLIGMKMYLRLFEQGELPQQRPHMAADLWEKEVRRVYGPLADQAIAKNTPYPPSGKEWEYQRKQIAKAMDLYGYKYIDRFKTLLPTARDKIIAMGGPVRPDQLGYSRQETYDAIAFGKEVRPKFTTLRLAERFGWLYDLAEEIANGLPEGKIY